MRERSAALHRRPFKSAAPQAETSVMRGPSTWSLVVQSLTRPYRVSLFMVLLLVLVPFYIFIAVEMRGRPVYTPGLAVDDLVPLRPTWALVYGPVYLFLILLPVFVVRQQEHIRRTFQAYLLVWVSAYVCFLVYPTVAPRPDAVAGSGFGVWGLRFLYGADPPYNCFPSLHVAHSFVSALAVFPVHRRVALAATGGAWLVGLSTLYTKQHYVVDVLAGVFLASVAYAVFLRNYAGADIPELDRRLAPVFAVGILAIVAVVAAGFWIAYQMTN